MSSSASRLRRRTASLNRLLSRHMGRPTTTTSGEDLHTARVLYVVMGSHERFERTVLQSLTWCKHASCVFVSDLPSANFTFVSLEREYRLQAGRTAKDCCANGPTSLRDFFCSSHRSKTMGAQYRYLPALLWAKRELLGSRPSGHDWVALVDDDSFVFPQSVARLLTRYNASEPLHFGDFWLAEPAARQGASEARERKRLARGSHRHTSPQQRQLQEQQRLQGAGGKPVYACGGGGSVFSRGALLRMDLTHCIRRLHTQCSQSDWMVGLCAKNAGVQMRPEHGCTCVKWRDDTEARVRERLRRGQCSFLQFPNSPGSRAGPFKDLVPNLRNLTWAPAIVHQLKRLV